MVCPLEAGCNVADDFFRQSRRLGVEDVTQEVGGQGAEVVASDEGKVVAVGRTAAAGRYL